jgi:hypothetical protein
MDILTFIGVQAPALLGEDIQMRLLTETRCVTYLYLPLVAWTLILRLPAFTW